MSALMQNGLELALFGMGTVFVFLTVLVLATMAMSKIIISTTDLPVEPQPIPLGDPASDKRRIAAISAAIERFRADHER